jgi:hypothetical protein
VALYDDLLRDWPRAVGRRDGGFYQARLAIACAASGPLDRARAEGRKALTTARATQSATAARELRQLHDLDHQTGAIVWCSPGRNAQTLQAFFTELGERKGSIRAVSIDMSGGYAKAINENTRGEICFDPFPRCSGCATRRCRFVRGARPCRRVVAAARVRLRTV